MTRRLLAMLIALVGTAAVVVVGLSTFAPEEDRATIVPPGPVRRVEVDVEVGRVAVVAGPADAVTVERTRRYLRGVPVAEETVADGVLRIHAECPRVITFGCAVDYRVAVPAGVAVKIRTGRGAVTVADIAGMVEVATTSGSVRLDHTHGPARVTTSGGNVDGVDLAAGFLDATTGAGRIRLSLEEPPGRLGLNSGAGDIAVALPAVAGGYRVDATTKSGNVKVDVEQNPGGNRAITAMSGGGNVRVSNR